MDMRQWILNKVLLVPAVLIAFTISSFAQAAVADKLGDKNPRFQGRLTLNPLSHIDLMGFIMILIIGLGWGKPMEIRAKNSKDELKIRISGIIANFLTAIIFTIVFGIMLKIFEQYYESNVFIANVGVQLVYLCKLIIVMNFVVGFFSIIPLPGLNGFYIIKCLFPKFFYNVLQGLYQYQMIILIVFIIPIGSFSIASILVGIPSNTLADFLTNTMIKIIM